VLERIKLKGEGLEGRNSREDERRNGGFHGSRRMRGHSEHQKKERKNYSYLVKVRGGVREGWGGTEPGNRKDNLFLSNF